MIQLFVSLLEVSASYYHVRVEIFQFSECQDCPCSCCCCPRPHDIHRYIRLLAIFDQNTLLILHDSAKVVSLMKEIFPELVDAEARVAAVLKDEEMAFNRTLDKGLKEFNKVASGLGDTK